MDKKVLRITDKRGTWFRLKVATRDIKSKAGSAVNSFADFINIGVPSLSGQAHWLSMDEGFIRPRSGLVRVRASSNGDLTTRDALILAHSGIKTHDGNDLFGMQLFEYEDWLSVNDEGEGIVIQPWVLSLVPGRIRWSVIDDF
jgi:hypothetical protein